MAVTPYPTVLPIYGIMWQRCRVSLAPKMYRRFSVSKITPMKKNTRVFFLSPFSFFLFFSCVICVWFSPYFAKESFLVSHGVDGKAVRHAGQVAITLSLPRVINYKFLLQPDQKYNIWRIWLFIAYSDERWFFYQFSLHRVYICL